MTNAFQHSEIMLLTTPIVLGGPINTSLIQSK
jgi:hypothetical protein